VSEFGRSIPLPPAPPGLTKALAPCPEEGRNAVEETTAESGGRRVPLAVVGRALLPVEGRAPLPVEGRDPLPGPVIREIPLRGGEGVWDERAYGWL
jgi:hypothetical protein